MRAIKREDGTALIETSLVLPLLLILSLGIAEIGFLAIDYLTVTNAAREGARVGAAAGDYVDTATGLDADDLIIEAIEQVACNLEYGTLTEVRVFKADADGNPVDAVNLLNRYAPAGPLQCASASTALTCTNTCPWAVSTRDRKLPGLDQLGIEVRFSHDNVVGFVPLPTVNWSERAVMRLEPDTRG